jgi:hypothetical protein
MYWLQDKGSLFVFNATYLNENKVNFLTFETDQFLFLAMWDVLILH